VVGATGITKANANAHTKQINPKPKITRNSKPKKKTETLNQNNREGQSRHLGDTWQARVPYAVALSRVFVSIRSDLSAAPLPPAPILTACRVKILAFVRAFHT